MHIAPKPRQFQSLVITPRRIRVHDWLVISAIAVWLAACGVQPEPPAAPVAIESPASPTATQAEVEPTSPPTVTPVPPTAPPPAAQIPAVMVVSQLLTQQLQVDHNSVQIAAMTTRSWSDTCLGVPYTGEVCTPAEISGYEILLTASGQEYTYNIDHDGVHVRLVNAPAPAIGERVLTWIGSDEIGCQTLEIGADGVAFGRCGQPLLGVPFNFDTRPADLAEFAGTYAPFEAETPAGTVNFAGQGSGQATPAEQRMVAEWARLVWQESFAGRSGASWGLALAWHREGGPDSACDDVTVYVTGTVFASSCRGGEPVDIGRGRLDSHQLATIYSWIDTLQPFEFAPNTSDAAVQVVFSGAGEQAPHELDMMLAAEFAETVYNELSMQTAALPEQCLAAGDGQQPLLQPAAGYCLLYPAHYSLVRLGPTAELVIDSVMNHIEPRISISTEDAAGRSLEDAVAQLEADYNQFVGFDVKRSAITIDGVEAVEFDKLPGQDFNRRVIFIHQGRLYSLFLSPIGDEGTDIQAEAELLYRQVIDSFRFLEAAGSGEAANPAEPEVLPSAVKYVMAQADVNIHGGPGLDFPVIGGVFGGQIALVTGITANGEWWRVICPDDTVGNCFVTTDPTLVQPTDPPGGQ